MSHITFVKRVLADGQISGLCSDVNRQLQEDGLINQINHLVLADVNDDDSIGNKLASKFNVTRIPFFLVDDGIGETRVFECYDHFKQFIRA